MKRVASACLLQTLNFLLDPNFSNEEAKEKVKMEVAEYKKNTSPNKVIIMNETLNNDGSITLSVKKTVSGYPIGKYFD